MISRNELRPIRDQLERARVMVATLPLRGLRGAEAADLLESAIGQIDELIARPTAAMLYVASKERGR